MNAAIPVILSFFVQVVLVLALAPLITGIIKKAKARFQHRRGATILQPYYDLAKLMRKEVVVSSVASWLFHCTPFVVFSSTVVITFLVPTVVTPVPLHWLGDIITVIYLFALGRFFIALVGLDTGSAFGGLGSSREMSIASIIEPAMMLAIFTAAVTAGSTNLSIIVERLSSTPAAMLNPSHLLAFAGLFIVSLAETGRIPVDNPATHLELTMIHEAMILEYSGPYLALIEWSSQVKLVVFLALMSNMFFPLGMATTWSPWALAIGCGAFLAKITGLALIVATVESTNAKLRLFRVPELLVVAFILSLLSLILSHCGGMTMNPGHLPTVELLIDIFAAAILVTAFLIVSSRSLVFYIRLFALQSLLLGMVALLVVIGYGETHILIAAVLTIALKAVAIPVVLTRIIERIHVQKELRFSISITASLLLCGGIVILADSVAQSILRSPHAGASPVSRVLSVSIAMMLIGLLIMMTRQKALTQIIGLLTLENGVFLSGLSITYGMPLIVEVGIFFDILVAVLILGVFVFRINKTFESISIDSLRSLRH